MNLFQADNKRQTKKSLRRTNEPIIYKSIRDDFIFALKGARIDPKFYGLHSLRAGGASAAANAGVSDILIQKHGRWRSVGVKNRYISEDIDNLLLVSKNLGL